MTDVYPHRKTPCGACPWRKASGSGWLGGSSPERFALQNMMIVPLPCHSSIDYEDPNWEQLWEDRVQGVLCAGALINLANTCKLPHDRRVPRLKPSDKVFAHAQEFIDHHRKGHRSWSDAEDELGKAAWAKFKVFPLAPAIVEEFFSGEDQ